MIQRSLILAALVALPLPASADRELPLPDLDLATVADRIAERYRGRLLSVSLERPEGRERGLGADIVFEAEYLTPRDNVLIIRVDGDSGRFLSVEGIGQARARVRP